jgi:hypothetical protein
MGETFALKRERWLPTTEIRRVCEVVNIKRILEKLLHR